MPNIKTISDNFLFSCVYNGVWSGEKLIEEHILCHLVSGKIEFITEEGLKILYPDSTGLIKRNKLVKMRKYSDENGQPCKAVNVVLPQKVLQQYGLKNGIDEQEHTISPGLQHLPSHPLLGGYFDSIRPFEKYSDLLSPAMVMLKTNEAIRILLMVKPTLKKELFHFSQPHKIDLEQFMLKNFVFNVPLKQFAKRSGRSLSTFKRDFAEIFSATPAAWLRKKRLEHAHYLIEEKEESPSEVYHKSGFKNFSHFSTAFKGHFGYAPSTVNQ